MPLEHTHDVDRAASHDARRQVRIEQQGEVAFVVIDHPPVNAGSAAVRRGILQAVETIDADPGIRAAVLIGAGNTFIAGSDLQEFERPLQDPQWPEVIAAIESSPKPFIAALHGAALGGGYELALGCDARIAAPGTVIGLPEVTLGLIPGAGGTQRLPRLIGIPDALRLICNGERVGSAQARALGLIDSEVSGDLRAAAQQQAQLLGGRKCRVRDLAIVDAAPGQVDTVLAKLLPPGKTRPAVHAAAQAVQMAASLPIDAALARERAVFQELRVSEEAAALRYQFFAERKSARHPQLQGVQPRDLRMVGVIGAGTMGSGIAIAGLDGGLDVLMVERDDAALARGVASIEKHYRRRVESGKLSADVAGQRLANLRSSTDWAALEPVDLVIEAVFEDIEVKREVFAKLDAVVRSGAVLASNTSYLDLDLIAESTSRPEDVIGLHFFSPAQVMRLLEVVRTDRSSPEVLATGLKLARRLGKCAVLACNAFGFIGNRVYAAYRRQCEFMLEEGASPEQIDAALEAFGFAMGPFAVADLSGLDIAWRMRRAQGRNPSVRYVEIADRLCETGRLGRKAGAGYYRYDEAGGRHVDPAVGELIDELRAQAGLQARQFEAEEIQRRALLAMANEAALLLAENVAARASDVDVVLVNGFGFPRWRGGAVFWACQRGPSALSTELDWLAQRSGSGFVRADVRMLFEGE